MSLTAHVRCAIALAGLLSAFASVRAEAQVPISAEDFSRRPEAWEVSMSPTGMYVAIAVPTPDGMETQLRIVELATGKTQVLRFGRQMNVSDVVWTADDQVVVSKATLEPLKARPTSAGELFTSDIRGKNQDVLFGYIPDDGTKRGRRRDEGWSEIVEVLDNEPGMALVRFVCWNCGEEPDTVIFKSNTLTGERKEVERADKLATYEFDQSGEARLRRQFNDNDEPVLSYRPRKGDAWTPLPKAIAGYMMYNMRFDANGNNAYALISDAMEPYQAYKIDLAAGTRTKLAGREDANITSFLYEGRNGAPFAVYYNADKPSIQYINPDSDWARLHAGLLKSFPGQMVTLGDVSRDGNRIGFYTWSDRSQGSYYIYDRGVKKLQKVIDFSPWLKPEQLAPMTPITFQGVGGEKLYGFYTAKAGGSSPPPLIVLPHGGPYGIADTWGFDNQVQFLASRGYAVLQVNYRGSGGRGELFECSGWKGWGTKLQDDIFAGVRWAIDNKMADPNRICTFGASFGGYSALIQPILHPDTYKCAIGYVGVYDLPLMRKTDTNLGIAKRTDRFFDRTLGTDVQALASISPTQRISELNVPVFLIHGRDDHTANFNQYKSMEAALRAAGKPAETMVVAGEGHGFVKPENVAELYRRIESFLGKNIGR